jgi:hypothetical protein
MALAAGACATAPRKTAPAEAPGLVVPVIPPRVFAPLAEAPVEEPQAPEPEVECARRRRASRPRPRPERPAEAKPDTAKPDAPQAEAAPGPGDVPTPPLRTPQIADDTETGRRIRATIGRASVALNKVTLATMSGDAHGMRTARRFVDQAEGALTARNYMFARALPTRPRRWPRD